MREECLISKGKTIVEERPVDSFSHVEIKDVFDVVLKQDTAYRILIEAGKNLTSLVKTTIINDTLTITNDARCKWIRDYERVKVTICFKDIRRVYVYEPTHLTSYDTIKVDDLWLWTMLLADVDLTIKTKKLLFISSHVSNGKAILRGSVTYMELGIFGGMQLDALQLNVDGTTIEQNSIGDLKVNVASRITYKINSSGNIYYTGNPEVVNADTTTGGSGKLVRLEQ